MDIGTVLRTARERHELTLAQLASRTKIPVGILQALETNHFETVPRGIFVRGFLRAYATEVGLDPTLIVAQFLLESGDAVPAGPEGPSSGRVGTDDEIERVPLDPSFAGSGPGWGYVLMVAVLVVALVSMNRYSGNAGDEPRPTVAASGEQLPAVAAATATAALADVVPTSGRTFASPADGAGTDMLRFDLQVEAECWVEAVVDGRRVVYRLMQPGERQTLESTGEIVLRVGDPGALTYSVNGAPGKPLGRAGIPVTVRFTNQGA